MQLICCALAFAAASAGNNMPAKIAMIAMDDEKFDQRKSS